MDVATLIGGLLQSNWELENVSIDDNITTIYIDLPKLSFRYDEFDPKSPELQILIENYPARSTWIIGGFYRIEHGVRISLYQKLIQYRPIQVNGYSFNAMDVYRKIWYSVKHEIDRILIKYKYTVENIISITNGIWTDILPTIAVGRGIKTTSKPIVWRTEQVITTLYYQNEGLKVE